MSAINNLGARIKADRVILVDLENKIIGDTGAAMGALPQGHGLDDGVRLGPLVDAETRDKVAELVDSVPWKWWAKYQTFDKKNAKIEVVDLFHFLISLAQVLGMTAEDVFAVYTQKNKVNFERQDSGYQVKDEQDNQKIQA